LICNRLYRYNFPETHPTINRLIINITWSRVDNIRNCHKRNIARYESITFDMYKKFLKKQVMVKVQFDGWKRFMTIVFGCLINVENGPC
jgi:hypothetical protein